ncbi:UBX domain-containing protein 2B [Drosophila grimshawi]|uniref:GH20898 n=1 Tax=Drosophila grimshawi TaxID=7222 RepID=B4J4V1_DROGR|nr:UBX domain-containing protein 2B [Drosophila grimshawi]EDW00647.1 GH20898 [Drosophila grimshawi]
MSDEQKLASFMKKYGEQEAVARHYLATNNWALEQAGLKYEADRSKERGRNVPDLNSLQSLLSRQTLTRATPREAYLGDVSESSVRQQHQQLKRVHIEDSTPALTTADSDRSLRAWGHGVSLGSAHPIIPLPPRASGSDSSDQDENESEQSVVILHLWSEGFTLGEGPLRLYEIPENDRFLRRVMRGDFPNEMLELGQRMELTVRDHTNTSYRELSRKQFMGFGRALSSPPSSLVTADGALSPTEQQQEQQQQEQEQSAIDSLQLNRQTGMTTIQFRLADGSRISAQFNTTHNVGDLYRFVRMARPQYASENFLLMTAFPRNELIETDQRPLAETNLLNVVIIQHINEREDPQQVDQSTD